MNVYFNHCVLCSCSVTKTVRHTSHITVCPDLLCLLAIYLLFPVAPRVLSGQEVTWCISCDQLLVTTWTGIFLPLQDVSFSWVFSVEAVVGNCVPKDFTWWRVDTRKKCVKDRVLEQDNGIIMSRVMITALIETIWRKPATMSFVTMLCSLTHHIPANSQLATMLLHPSLKIFDSHEQEIFYDVKLSINLHSEGQKM